MDLTRGPSGRGAGVGVGWGEGFTCGCCGFGGDYGFTGMVMGGLGANFSCGSCVCGSQTVMTFLLFCPSRVKYIHIFLLVITFRMVLNPL